MFGLINLYAIKNVAQDAAGNTGDLEYYKNERKSVFSNCSNQLNKQMENREVTFSKEFWNY